MNIRDFLRAEKMTAEEFGELGGASKHAVGTWGRRERIPRPEIMRRIAEVTDGQVGAADFFEQEAA